MIQSVSIAEERSGTGEILISLALILCVSQEEQKLPLERQKQ